MTLHRGKTYRADSVSLEAPVPEMLLRAAQGSDVLDSAAHWLREAIEEETVYCFAVCENDKVVGQVLLHDMDEATGEALVAYDLFEPANRGRGIGTGMLQLLQQFVREETSLASLFIITSRDNLASQRLAIRCGFSTVGASREDPVNGMVFEWQAARVSD